jgi:hypothetical protein
LKDKKRKSWKLWKQNYIIKREREKDRRTGRAKKSEAERDRKTER